MIFYHGSLRPRKTWDLSSLGQGNDQYGPGWYFTDNEKVAKSYADGPEGVLQKCDINVSNVCPNVGDTDRFRSRVARMMKAAPQARTHLENWGENPREALNQALDLTLDSTEGPHDLIQQVWIDFYLDQEGVWAKNVLKLFRWSLALPDSSDTGGDQYAVVWDPSAITILSTVRV
jgi:hypothetical protein